MQARLGAATNTMADERYPAIRITMLPRDTNAYGTIFGGVILSYIDLAGGIEARKRTGKKFVTKAMREVVFVAPVFLGDLVTFYTRTIRTGRTSITIDVEVESERLGPAGNKEIVKVTEAEVIFVAVDNDGRPVSLAD
jgi:acyl-CoA thioesterase YciA